MNVAVLVMQCTLVCREERAKLLSAELGYAQARASRAWIGVLLFGSGFNGLLRDDGQCLWMRSENVLHDPVLAAVITHHHNASMRSQQGNDVRKRPLQPSQFIVDGDAQCLKQPRQRFRLMMRRDMLYHEITQIDRCAQWRQRPTLHNGLCQAARLRFIPIGEEQCGKRFF